MPRLRLWSSAEHERVILHCETPDEPILVEESTVGAWEEFEKSLGAPLKKCFCSNFHFW